MRKVCFFIGFIILCNSLSAQNTTQDEYNFMTKGYSQMVESGLDMKRGYYLSDTSGFSTMGRKYSFVYINMKRGKDHTLAGTIVIAKSGISGKTYYLGIPSAKSDLSIDLEGSLMVQIESLAWDNGIKTAFLQSLAEYLMLKATASIKK